jgi:hypothetical protein
MNEFQGHHTDQACSKSGIISPEYHDDVAPNCALHFADDCARQRKGLARGKMCILGHLSSN